MPQSCVEVVAYTVPVEKLDRFQKIRKKLMRDIGKLEGFVSATTLQSHENPQLFIDMMTWKSRAQAQRAFEKFPELPSAKAFMSTVGEVRFSDHMQPLD